MLQLFRSRHALPLTQKEGSHAMHCLRGVPFFTGVGQCFSCSRETGGLTRDLKAASHFSLTPASMGGQAMTPPGSSNDDSAGSPAPVGMPDH